MDKRNEYQSLTNIEVFNNIATYRETRKRTHCELKFVGKRKNLSVSAPPVPAEQLSTSV